MKKLEIGPATAIAGVAAFSIHQMYTQHAGSLNDAREATPGDPEVRQRLADADILTGALVLIVGGAISTVTRQIEPLALAVTVYGFTAIYYHRACEG